MCSQLSLCEVGIYVSSDIFVREERQSILNYNYLDINRGNCTGKIVAKNVPKTPKPQNPMMVLVID